MNLHGMDVFTVDTVIEELLITRERRGVSSRWLYSLENLLCRFAAFAPGPLANVTPTDCDAFIHSLNLCPRSRNNVVGMLRQLFRFAAKRRYIPADFLPLATLELSLVNDAEVQLYTPDEMRRILAHCRAVLPLVVLTGFCGVRWSEAARLEWDDIDLERKVVFVRATKAKTRSRRVCPVPDNAAVWLAAGGEGPLWSTSLPCAFRALAKALSDSGVTPRRNGLRHSFISYRLAELMDAQRVALEAGTSPQMIFSNYRELVTPEMAREWWEVKPGAVTPDAELELVA